MAFLCDTSPANLGTGFLLLVFDSGLWTYPAHLLLAWRLDDFLMVPDYLAGYSSEFEWFMGEYFKTALGMVTLTVAGLGSVVLRVHDQLVMKNLARNADFREQQARRDKGTVGQ